MSWGPQICPIAPGGQGLVLAWGDEDIVGALGGQWDIDGGDWDIGGNMGTLGGTETCRRALGHGGDVLGYGGTALGHFGGTLGLGVHWDGAGGCTGTWW